MPGPFSLPPSAAETLTRLLRTDGIALVAITTEQPVRVGIARTNVAMRWFHGADLEAALGRAADALQTRIVIEEDP